MQKKEPKVKVPTRLLAELIAPAHAEADSWLLKARHNEETNNFDIARNCLSIAREWAATANEARVLLGLPPFPY
jgi:hypothetical protein